MVKHPTKPASGPPIGVKLGGACINGYQIWSRFFLLPGTRCSLFPGGMFADAIRKSRIDDDSAHWMAIASLDQYGWFIASQGIMATAFLQVPDRPVVFLPYCSMRKHDPLPHSWDVTSDTIAAWVADILDLDLLLLKSVDGILENGSLMKKVRSPVKTGVVDPFFIPFVLEKKLKATIINGSRVDLVERFLRGEPVSGTKFGTTF